MRADYKADGFGTRGKNLDFLSESPSAEAWSEAVRLNAEGWGGKVPNIAWRAHIACWAAKHGLSLNGDFIECGVHTGLLSATICRYLDFASRPRKFWLFDTWGGIPMEGLNAAETAAAEKASRGLYNEGAYPIAVRNFAPYPNVYLVRGILPKTLDDTPIESVAYLSIDLNNAYAERAVIERLWPKLSKGAIVLLDDYGFLSCREQHDMWDDFARVAGTLVATLPTGQGLLIK